jgi:dihydroorotase
VVHDHRINEHCWCAPVAKDEASRQRLVAAATGQIPEVADRTHLGLDYAPHLIELKEVKEWPYPPLTPNDVPPMGSYSLPEAVPLLVALFERTLAGGPNVWLPRLLKFGRTNGPKNYGVSIPNRRDIRLVREPWTVPAAYLDLQGRPTVRSFMAGREISWKVIGAKL